MAAVRHAESHMSTARYRLVIEPGSRHASLLEEEGPRMTAGQMIGTICDSSPLYGPLERIASLGEPGTDDKPRAAWAGCRHSSDWPRSTTGRRLPTTNIRPRRP